MFGKSINNNTNGYQPQQNNSNNNKYNNSGYNTDRYSTERSTLPSSYRQENGGDYNQQQQQPSDNKGIGGLHSHRKSMSSFGLGSVGGGNGGLSSGLSAAHNNSNNPSLSRTPSGASRKYGVGGNAHGSNYNNSNNKNYMAQQSNTVVDNHNNNEEQDDDLDLVIRECPTDDYSSKPSSVGYGKATTATTSANNSSNKKQRINGVKGMGSSGASSGSNSRPQLSALRELNLAEQDNTGVGGLSSGRHGNSKYQLGVPQNGMVNSNSNSIMSNSNMFLDDSSCSQQPYYLEIQELKQYLRQTMLELQHQYSSEFKKLKTQQSAFKKQYSSDLDSIMKQVTTEFNKQQRQINLHDRVNQEFRASLAQQNSAFQTFVSQNQERLESLVMQLRGNSTKRSVDQFGVDMKGSGVGQAGMGMGVGTSMSMSMQYGAEGGPGGPVGMRVVNQINMQIEALKGQVENCQAEIAKFEAEGNKRDEKIRELECQHKKIAATCVNVPNTSSMMPSMHEKPSFQLPSSSAPSTKQILQQIKPDLDRLIKQKIPPILSKHLPQKLDSRLLGLTDQINTLTTQTKDLYKVYQDVDSNIKGMNAQFTRVINGTVIKKEKMLEGRVITLQEKSSNLSKKLEDLTRQVDSQPRTKLQLFQETISKMAADKTLVRVRRFTQKESNKIGEIMKTKQITYMLDQQGYLLDSEGYYLIDESMITAGVGEGGKNKKIRLNKDLQYLLETQGIAIESIAVK